MTPTVSRKTYAFTWLALLALTLATTRIAVAIAGIKAALIAACFMHALFEARLVRAVIAVGVLWFLMLVSLTLTDYISRGWLPFPGK